MRLIPNTLYKEVRGVLGGCAVNDPAVSRNDPTDRTGRNIVLQKIDDGVHARFSTTNNTEMIVVLVQIG